LAGLVWDSEVDVDGDVALFDRHKDGDGHCEADNERGDGSKSVVWEQSDEDEGSRNHGSEHDQYGAHSSPVVAAEYFGLSALETH
jgi:hypothetical protein